VLRALTSQPLLVIHLTPYKEIIMDTELAFEDKDELTQSETNGAYWCEGCYSWQLPAGHEEHIDTCDCNY